MGTAHSVSQGNVSLEDFTTQAISNNDKQETACTNRCNNVKTMFTGV